MIQNRLTSSNQSKLTPLSRRLLGVSMMHCPKILLEIISSPIALVITSFLIGRSCIANYDFDDQRVLLSNHGTDVGGGGIRRELFLKICDVNRVMNLLEYIYTTCALHALNICISSPTTLTMGDGRLLKRNALQCLHTAYNLAQ